MLDYLEDDLEVRDVNKLSDHEVTQITEQFIRDLANCNALHNFMEDAGGLPGDLDEFAQMLAKVWLQQPNLVSGILGQDFWHKMKSHALTRWVKGYD